MTDLLIDTSAWQGQIDFAALKGHVAGLYAKATQGLHSVDEQFRRSRDVARNRGIPCGGYHFVEMGADGALQAQHFLATMGTACTLIPMIDIEEGSFADASRTLLPGVPESIEERISRFSHLIASVDRTLPIGKRCLIYTNYDTWTTYMGNTDAFCGHPLWCAQSLDPRTSGLFGGWKSAALWQYGEGRVPGITGTVDLDKLLVPIERLQR